MTMKYGQPYRRTQDEHTVKDLDGGRVNMTDSWSMPADIFPDDVAVGETYIVETVLGSTPCAVYRRTFYKSDEDLDNDHRAFVANMEAEHQERLDANREDWARREAALPAPLRARMDNFREKSRGKFDREGWGYELVVSELAVLYAKQALDPDDPEAAFIDTDEINEYGNREGTSGNQHGFAKALAMALRHDPEAAASAVSALSMLGTGPYYEEA